LGLDPDLALALELADTADAITRRRFGAPELATQRKPDASPVSEVDREVKAKVMFAVQQPLHRSALEVMGVPAWKSLPTWFLIADGDQVTRPMPSGSSPLAWAPPPWRSRPTTWPWSPHPDEVLQLIKTAAEAVPAAA